MGSRELDLIAEYIAREGWLPPPYDLAGIRGRLRANQHRLPTLFEEWKVPDSNQERMVVQALGFAQRSEVLGAGSEPVLPDGPPFLIRFFEERPVLLFRPAPDQVVLGSCDPLMITSMPQIAKHFEARVDLVFLTRSAVDAGRALLSRKAAEAPPDPPATSPPEEVENAVDTGLSSDVREDGLSPRLEPDPEAAELPSSVPPLEEPAPCDRVPDSRDESELRPALRPSTPPMRHLSNSKGTASRRIPIPGLVAACVIGAGVLIAGLRSAEAPGIPGPSVVRTPPAPGLSGSPPAPPPSSPAERPPAVVTVSPGPRPSPRASLLPSPQASPSPHPVPSPREPTVASPRPSPRNSPIAQGPAEVPGKVVGILSFGGQDVVVFAREGAQELVDQGGVFAGWTVARVYPDRVVMQKGNDSQVLLLEKETVPTQNPTSTATPAR